ncbi:MAG: GNAT family N-acetyltransferase [Planctomycetota bacterium]|nr:GNAT family N-acetyltransferase [Planctomycetota bacterium]MDA1114657.1 GNAT family N-acetyltransferase [Planctomycetota bacterium]
MHILRATLEHLDSLVPLFDGYRAFYAQDSAVDSARSYLKKRLELDEAVVFMAFSAADAVQALGFVLLYPHFSSVSLKRVWILNDLFIDPAARRQGVANRLLATAEAFGCQNQAKGLQLETDKVNFKAKALYESRGWILDCELDHYSFLVENQVPAKKNA